jgi:hypothetical protein
LWALPSVSFIVQASPVDLRLAKIWSDFYSAGKTE